ncbi:MAG: hypothetical protein Q7J44_15170 [Pseudotabrizicola sp.]|uniref:hypothetical protein n=1 Tax=Pseudotabrizicola sp. TaxID=2939647 RepID=UPI00271B2C2A|nr:hypothetical protein [Pseudotabrizicola sp.]MDO9639877.1 hypothetical protein [Pseudotabrizicola sp.]
MEKRYTLGHRVVTVAACGLALALAACSPQDMADKVARTAARSVVVPVVQQYMPGPAAEGVATCIIDNANAAEISSLARDVGTRAGTSTVQTVMTVAQRPATLQCLATSGLPRLAG